MSDMGQHLGHQKQRFVMNQGRSLSSTQLLATSLTADSLLPRSLFPSHCRCPRRNIVQLHRRIADRTSAGPEVRLSVDEYSPRLPSLPRRRLTDGWKSLQWSMEKVGRVGRTEWEGSAR